MLAAHAEARFLLSRHVPTLYAVVIAAVADPRATSDTFLILADALTEAAEFYRPRAHMLRSVHALERTAWMLRDLAPARAGAVPA